MKYIEHLLREHRLLEEMHGQLERWLASPSELAPSHVESVLRAYLQALERHEAFARLMFRPQAPGKRRRGLPAKRRLAHEHEDLAEIKDVLRFILDHLNADSYPAIKRTIENLGDRLRRHYRIEEEEIWPAMAHAGDPMPKNIDARAAAQEAAMRALLDEVRL